MKVQTFRELLLETLKETGGGLSRREVSALTGQSHVTVTKDLQNDYWKADKVKRYCDALGIPLRKGMMLAGLTKPGATDANPTIRETIADALRQKRQERRLPLREVALFLNMPEEDLLAFEEGLGLPDAILLIRLAGLYACSIDELLQRPTLHDEGLGGE